MWSNIGNVEEHKDNLELYLTPRQSIDSTGQLNNNAMIIYADCHSANKGLFTGM